MTAQQATESCRPGRERDRLAGFAPRDPNGHMSRSTLLVAGTLRGPRTCLPSRPLATRPPRRRSGHRPSRGRCSPQASRRCPIRGAIEPKPECPRPPAHRRTSEPARRRPVGSQGPGGLEDCCPARTTDLPAIHGSGGSYGQSADPLYGDALLLPTAGRAGSGTG